MAITLTGSAFAKVIPKLSSMFIPSSTFQLKQLTSEPNIKYNILMAKGKPGQILRPAPNGSLAISDSSTAFPLPMISSSSCFAFDITFSFRTNSAIAHSSVDVIVSVPATYKV
ncbi:hypothetical protein CR513_15363, partial [Mucuna pruriens]